MTVSEDEFFRQRGFGQKIGFGERPALIIIDIVKAFTDATRMLGANLDSQIQAIRPLLEVTHERGFPVLFSTVRYEERELRDAGLWGIKMKGSATLKADGKTAEFHIYPGAPHGFVADYRPSYRKEAAEDAWNKMTAWFKKYGVLS